MIQSIVHRARRRLAILVAIPVVSALAVYFVRADARKENNWVKHTLVVQLSLERLYSYLLSAESAQRGFLVTNEERYLEPYKATVAQVRQEMANLRRLTVDNEKEHRAIEEIEPLVTAKLDYMEKTVDLHRQSGPQAATEVSRVDHSMAVMNSIRGILDRMRHEESRLLEERDLRLARASERLTWCLAIGYVLGLIVMGSLYRSAERYSRRVAEAEASLSRLNADLEQRVQDRTASLRASEELLQLFVKRVPAATAMFDREMRYLQVSDRWCTDYSLVGSQILGRSHYEIFPDIPERWKELHRRGMGGESVRVNEDFWERPNGENIWLRWEIRPWGGRDGVPDGILIFSEDISENKRIEEALREGEATTRTLLETAAQAILAVNVEGNIVLANRMAEEMFGHGRDELLGSPLEMLLPPAIRERHAGHRAGFASNPRNRTMGIGLDLLGLRKDGSQFPIEISLSSVETARGPLAVAFVTDITHRKQVETALRNTEIELRALTGSLLTASEEEHRRLARDLHDDVTQRLALLSIEIGKLAANVHLSMEETRLRFPALQQQVSRISDAVRRLSHGLHPSIIEDLGLSTALEELCEEFSDALDINIDFDGAIDKKALNSETASRLHRIAQEASRRRETSRATEVRVSRGACSDSIVARKR